MLWVRVRSCRLFSVCVGGCACSGGVCGCGLGRNCSVLWRFLYYNHLLVDCMCPICCVEIL